MGSIAIQVNNLSKVYKLYEKKSDRLKEALSLSGKKHYKEFYALNDISFEVMKGETVGIIGTNGSGKSTLLKILTGVVAPTAGSFFVKGRISALLELGTGFNPEYTGLENIVLNGTMMGYTTEEIEARKQQIIDFADIGDFINQPVKTYSSGMFVRLAFAVAINIDPEILIVDEALSVGDVFFQAKCYNKFAEFKRQGKTILFVSHDLSSISKYCDRAILINNGEKLNEGMPKEIIDEYKQLIVQNDYKAPDSQAVKNVAESTEREWKQSFSINPNHLSYGDGKATIIDFGIADEKRKLTHSIMKGTTFTVRMKVRFNAKVAAPIFAMTIKDLKGTEITGTNTLLEGKPDISAQPGDVYTVEFKQSMSLQGGDYLLSFGCTGFENEDFSVYHRLYDIINLNVVSSKNTVGFYDMNSEVIIKKDEEAS